jgi:hypothetical protein
MTHWQRTEQSLVLSAPLTLFSCCSQITTSGEGYTVSFCLNIHIPVCKTAYQRILITRGKKHQYSDAICVLQTHLANSWKQKLSRKNCLECFHAKVSDRHRKTLTSFSSLSMCHFRIYMAIAVAVPFVVWTFIMYNLQNCLWRTVTLKSLPVSITILKNWLPVLRTRLSTNFLHWLSQLK